MSRRTDIFSTIIRATNEHGGVAPDAIAMSPIDWAGVAAEMMATDLFPPSTPAASAPQEIRIAGVQVLADPFCPPDSAYVIGCDPAYAGADATAIARIQGGQITSVTVTNGGTGYTVPPSVLMGELATITRRAFIPRAFGSNLGTRVDAETAQRSKERARGLLKSLLTEKQWAEFEAAGHVTERIDGCVFKLTPGGMIEAKKPRLLGSVNERWCVNPDPYHNGNDFMPEEDKLIGQLLHLRAGPDKVRAMANVFT